MSDGSLVAKRRFKSAVGHKSESDIFKLHLKFTNPKWHVNGNYILENSWFQMRLASRRAALKLYPSSVVMYFPKSVENIQFKGNKWV